MAAENSQFSVVMPGRLGTVVSSQAFRRVFRPDPVDEDGTGRSTLAEFAAKSRVQTREYHRFHSPEEVVARAESKLGESGYNLFNNNFSLF